MMQDHDDISNATLRTMEIEDIPSDKINRNILRKLKGNDPSLQNIEARADNVWFSDPSREEHQYYFESGLDLHALAVALGTNRSLKKLKLYGTNIGDEGARAFADALRTNCTLETLHLCRNKIGTEGALALADALGTNQSLKSLNLRINKIDNKGALAFAKALGTNCKLEDLNLDDNEIGAEGARAFADSLGNNQSLKKLYLNENSINNEGACAFAGALGANCTLEELHLNLNSIGNEGVLAVASALVNNSNLTHLDLRRQLVENDSDSINNRSWTKVSELLCDASSINATHCSNHTLQYVRYSSNMEGVLDKIKSYQLLNRVKSNTTLVRMEKILKCHRYFDMKPFFECGSKILPYVFDWLEKARSHASPDPARSNAERKRGSDNTIAIEEERIMNEKLNAIHEFARAMPDIFDREAQVGARPKRKHNMV